MRYGDGCKWGWIALVLLWTTGALAQVPAQPTVGTSPQSVVPPKPAAGPGAGTGPISPSPSMPPDMTTPPPPAGGAVSAAGAGTPGEVPATSASGEELVRLNVQDADIRDIIKQISLATGRNFILDDNVKGKITIISPKPVTKEEAYQTFLSALAVTGFTTVKGPAGVIKIVRLKDSIQYPIPTHVDSTPYTDSFVTRLIQMNNIGAVDMMNAIKALVSKDGNIYAYPSTNTLIITDSGTNIDRLMKIIKELDQEGPQQVLEIVPVRNALARDVATTLTTLFKQEKQKMAPKPGELEELDEVSNILSDERTNSIIVLASKRAIEKVRGIIARLDAKVASGQEGKIHVYYLKYAKAKQMAETLSALTSGTGQKPTGAPGGQAGGGVKVAEFEGGIKITADDSLNALIVTASAKDFQTLIDRVVSKLDKPRRQVYIEAVIMELELNKSRSVGVAANAGGGGLARGFGQTFNAATALTGAVAAGIGLPGASGILGGLISSRTVNLTMVGADGTSKTVSVPAFSAFLTALQTYGDTNIVSTPNILTVDNEEALIEIKRDQPIPSATPASATSATLTQSYTFKEAGLTLKITPQISADNSVLLKVDEELSNFGAPVNFGGNQNIPTSKKRHIKTTTIVADGQTVVLGGLMEDQISNSQNKIPILGDIPLLGFFFRQTTKNLQKNNLLIFLTPHIMNDATDFTRILQTKIEQRNKFIEQNYGRKQRELIKSTIRTHREDLLEFKTATEMLPDSTFPKEYPATSAVTSPVTPKKVVAPVLTPPPPGVITVPSLTPGSSASTYTPSTSSAAPVAKSKPAPASEPAYTPPKATMPAPVPAQSAANPISKPPPVNELNLTY